MLRQSTELYFINKNDPDPSQKDNKVQIETLVNLIEKSY